MTFRVILYFCRKKNVSTTHQKQSSVLKQNESFPGVMQPLVALYLCHAALSDLIFVLIQMENDCAKNKTAYTVEFSITKYWFRNVMQI